MANFPALCEEFESFLRSSLTDFETKDGGYSGFINTKDSFDDFRSNLWKLGIKFVVRTSTTNKKRYQNWLQQKRHLKRKVSDETSHEDTHTKTYDSISEGRIVYQSNHGVPVRMFGSPFIVEKGTWFTCVKGGKYRHGEKSPAEASGEVSISAPKRRRVCDVRNCPAYMLVKQVRVFVGERYSFFDNGLTDYELKKAKLKNIKRLKADLKLHGDSLAFILRFYVEISSLDIHTHGFEKENEGGQKVRPEVIQKIRGFVSEGNHSVHKVQMLLEKEITSKDGIVRNSPNLSDVRYLPSKKLIRNHIACAVKSQECIEIDQESLQALLNEWQEKNSFYSPPNVLFRDYKLLDTMDGLKSEFGASSIVYEHTFLFIHQDEWQQGLLNKYGSFCFIISHCKVTRYSLPLFFICVKTNVGYSIVGEFIVQFDTEFCINEALEMFQEWNPNWMPKYFIVDYNSIPNAIQSVFHTAECYFCDFHCEQEWTKWLSENDDVKLDKWDTVLKLWKNIAHAPTVTNYELRLKELYSSSIWIHNSSVQEYFNTTWLPTVKLWVFCFRSSGFLLSANVNNCVEVQNKVLNHTFFKGLTNKTVAKIIEMLIESYLPEMKKSYVEKNVCMCVESASTKDKAPAYLHNRPLTFIKFMMARTDEATVYDVNMINNINYQQGIFKVNCPTNNNIWYDVNFSIPRCSCLEFQKWRYPCQHFCAIFRLFPVWGFDKLPEEYLSNPLICVDNDVVTICPVSESLSGVDSVIIPNDNVCMEISETSKLKTVRKSTIQPMETLKKMQKTVKSDSTTKKSCKNNISDVGMTNLQETDIVNCNTLSKKVQKAAGLICIANNLIDICKDENSLTLATQKLQEAVNALKMGCKI